MAQQEYEQSRTVDAPPEEVFAWLSDVYNLPKYLPPVVGSSVEGPSAEGVPGQRIRMKLEYPGEGGGTFDAEGYLAVDERERTMEWGAEEGRDYSGWLTVADRGEGVSEVVVHLSFGERSAGPEIEEQSPEGRDPLAEGISATLESIRRQVEEGSDKLKVPPLPEGTEPQLEENPAVVDEDPSPDPPQADAKARQQGKHGKGAANMVKGVANVWVPVEDIERALDFYRDTLGFSVIKQDGPWAEVDANGLNIGLNGREPEGAQANGGPVITFQPKAGLEAAVEDLEGKRVKFTAGISEHEWGRVATFKDSEGNDLQLYEPPSG